MFAPLNLPPCEFRTKEGPDGPLVYDALRRRYVRLTPEEWVRQHFARFMIGERGYPASLLALEATFTYGGMKRRADILAHDRQGRPLLMVECKSPDVEAGQAAFDQVVRYNMAVGAPYLALTNGLVHFCCRVDPTTSAFTFLEDLPRYEEICPP